MGEKGRKSRMSLPTVATRKIRRTQICPSGYGEGTSESLRQLDNLDAGHNDFGGDTHSFASLLHNRFAFIGAIELKRASYREGYCPA
jgi:hypothetical protein